MLAGELVQSWCAIATAPSRRSLRDSDGSHHRSDRHRGPTKQGSTPAAGPADQRWVRE